VGRRWFDALLGWNGLARALGSQRFGGQAPKRLVAGVLTMKPKCALAYQGRWLVCLEPNPESAPERR
jgi:hypothetical protein